MKKRIGLLVALVMAVTAIALAACPNGDPVYEMADGVYMAYKLETVEVNLRTSQTDATEYVIEGTTLKVPVKAPKITITAITVKNDDLSKLTGNNAGKLYESVAIKSNGDLDDLDVPGPIAIAGQTIRNSGGVLLVGTSIKGNIADDVPIYTITFTRTDPSDATVTTVDASDFDSLTLGAGETAYANVDVDKVVAVYILVAE